METKDWIVLIVPIVSNGILLFAFQKLFEKQISKLNKRQDIRNEVFLAFWKKLQDLNDLFIQVNIQSRRDPSIAGKSVSVFGEQVLAITQYYDTNKYDLVKFESSFKKFQNSWNDFLSCWSLYANTPLTSDMQLALGQKLQLVKEANQELIDEVRKKY